MTSFDIIVIMGPALVVMITAGICESVMEYRDAKRRERERRMNPFRY